MSPKWMTCVNVSTYSHMHTQNESRNNENQVSQRGWQKCFRGEWINVIWLKRFLQWIVTISCRSKNQRKNEICKKRLTYEGNFLFDYPRYRVRISRFTAEKTPLLLRCYYSISYIFLLYSTTTAILVSFGTFTSSSG